MPLDRPRVFLRNGEVVDGDAAHDDARQDCQDTCRVLREVLAALGALRNGQVVMGLCVVWVDPWVDPHHPKVKKWKDHVFLPSGLVGAAALNSTCVQGSLRKELEAGRRLERAE